MKLDEMEYYIHQIITKFAMGVRSSIRAMRTKRQKGLCLQRDAICMKQLQNNKIKPCVRNRVKKEFRGEM